MGFIWGLFCVGLVLFGIASLFQVFFIVEQQTVAVVQRFGKFDRLATPGLHFKIPWIEHVAGRPSLRVQQLNVDIETKTNDNVFVDMTVAVQFYVLPSKVYDAFYRLEDPALQIKSFVFDVVRAKCRA